MTKKFLSLFLAILTIFALVACINLDELKNTVTNGLNSNTNEPTKDTNINDEIDDVDKVTDADDIEAETSSDDNLPENATKENLRLYFFDTEKLKLYYIDKDIVVIDKAKINALTKAHQENKDNDKFLYLTNKVGVSSAKLDGDILKIYFNEDFTKLMTLGTSTESGLVQSLVNTYGYNYKVNKVAIYFNNELYTGLKGDLPNGYFEVDTSNCEEYKK